MVDGVLVINEIANYAKSFMKDWLLFKINFEKAYHIICWRYLRKVMTLMGLENGV